MGKIIFFLTVKIFVITSFSQQVMAGGTGDSELKEFPSAEIQIDSTTVRQDNDGIPSPIHSEIIRCDYFSRLPDQVKKSVFDFSTISELGQLQNCSQLMNEFLSESTELVMKARNELLATRILQARRVPNEISTLVIQNYNQDAKKLLNLDFFGVVNKEKVYSNFEPLLVQIIKSLPHTSGTALYEKYKILVESQIIRNASFYEFISHELHRTSLDLQKKVEIDAHLMVNPRIDFDLIDNFIENILERPEDSFPTDLKLTFYNVLHCNPKIIWGSPRFLRVKDAIETILKNEPDPFIERWIDFSLLSNRKDLPREALDAYIRYPHPIEDEGHFEGYWVGISQNDCAKEEDVLQSFHRLQTLTDPDLRLSGIKHILINKKLNEHSFEELYRWVSGLEGFRKNEMLAYLFLNPNFSHKISGHVQEIIPNGIGHSELSENEQEIYYLLVVNRKTPIQVLDQIYESSLKQANIDTKLNLFKGMLLNPVTKAKFGKQIFEEIKKLEFEDLGKKVDILTYFLFQLKS